MAVGQIKNSFCQIKLISELTNVAKLKAETNNGEHFRSVSLVATTTQGFASAQIVNAVKHTCLILLNFATSHDGDVVLQWHVNQTVGCAAALSF